MNTEKPPIISIRRVLIGGSAGRFSKKQYLPAFLAACILAFVLFGAQVRISSALTISETPNEQTWVTNGSVNAIATDATSVYIGGSFTQVGPYVGCGVPLDETSASTAAELTKVVNGQVTAVASDGSGGWFIGGTFTAIGETDRKYIAHIYANGSLDPFWDPQANGAVNALSVSPDGTVVYAGGSFTSIGGQSRSYLAAISVSTGAATPWNPGADSLVNTIVTSSDGSTIYVGGYFLNIGGQPRSHIAAIDATLGQATSWDPEANSLGFVYTLALSPDGGTIYAGGQFNTIGGQNRNLLAALDVSSPGNATPWNPQLVGSGVDAIAVSTDGSTIYAGGLFSSVDGQARSDIAEIDAPTGSATPWSPDASGGAVSAIAIGSDGSTIYVGGQFSGIGGQNRSLLAAVDESGATTSWDPHMLIAPGGEVNALAAGNGTIYVGGNFSSVGAINRSYIAALSSSTGVPTSWNPGADNPVNALAVSGKTVYAGGNFLNIGGQARSRVAAIDTTSGSATYGQATPWNPGADGQINALLVAGKTIYAGGSFSNIGGQNRSNLAAIDAQTSAATAWNPGATGGAVRSLAVIGKTVYAAGAFTQIGGKNLNYLAALDSSTGAAKSWSPNPDNWVYTIVARGNSIYAGGAFTKVGTAGRSFIAAIAASSGKATSWNPNVEGGPVSALALFSNTVYAGGAFTSLGSGNKIQNRNGLAAINASTGLATTWNPNANGSVNALCAPSNNMVYAGGNFTEIGGRTRPNIAQFGFTYSISGTVRSSKGSPVSGATITLDGPSFATTTTGKNGAYSFTDLYSGIYTLSCVKAGFTFKQQTISATITNRNLTAKNFAGKP